MKNISKILAYTLCLQLTVGAYPARNHVAQAQEYKTEESGASRDPASATGLSMDLEEAVANSYNYLNVLKEQCTDAKGNFIDSRVFMHDKEIDKVDPESKNCGAARGVATAMVIPFMNQVEAQANANAANPNCVSGNCGAPQQDIGSAEGQEVSPLCQEKIDAAKKQGKTLDLASVQSKCAKEAEGCSFSCNVFGGKGCPASSGVSAKCVVELSKGILKGIKDVLLFPFILVKDIATWTWDHTFGSGGESKTAEQNHAKSTFTNKEIAEMKKDPKKAEAGLLERAGNFLKEFGKTVIGYPEFQEASKCANCSERADLMCGVIGNTAGFLTTIFGNGLIFGATKGTAARLANMVVKTAKRGSGVAKWTAKAALTTAKVTKTTVKAVGKYTGITWIGKIAVTGLGKAGKGIANGWSKFKSGKFYENLTQNWKVTKAVFNKNSIPGKITLSFGRGVKNAFNKMNAFEERMFEKGVKITNPVLYRAEKINALKAATKAAAAEKLAKGGIVDDVADGDKTSAAFEETWKGATEGVIVKDVADARPVQEWTDLKKAASNKLQGVKMKQLDDIENLKPVNFGSEQFNNGKSVENIVVAETSQGAREIKGVQFSDIKKDGVHEYQNGKYLLIEKNDGNFILHDVENGKHVTQTTQGKGKDIINGKEEFDALMGKETKTYGASLDQMSYEQVKTNLRINGTKFEEAEVAGQKVLKIETPNGCSPKVLTFGTKAI